MLEIIISASLMGLAAGTSCLVFCTPFFLPYLIGEKRKLKINFLELVKFMLGRLTGYLALGVIFGYFGNQVKANWLTIASTISLSLLSLLIILYGFNFFKINFCGLKFKRVKLPFWIGLFTGINICPPFLLSLNYIFILGDVLKGVTYFFFFFLATNIYFIPVIFLGQLSYLQEFQKIARVSMILIGFIFLIYSLYSLLTNQYFYHFNTNFRLLNNSNYLR